MAMGRVYPSVFLFVMRDIFRKAGSIVAEFEQEIHKWVFVFSSMDINLVCPKYSIKLACH